MEGNTTRPPSRGHKVVEEPGLVGVESLQIAQQEDMDALQRLFVQIGEESAFYLENGVPKGN